jgi:hypothetical protein
MLHFGHRDQDRSSARERCKTPIHLSKIAPTSSSAFHHQQIGAAGTKLKSLARISRNIWPSRELARKIYRRKVF